MVSLVKDGLLELAVAAKRAGMTVEEFEYNHVTRQITFCGVSYV